MKAVLLLLMALGSIADGYRILCIFGIPSKSHHLLGERMVDALLKAGHEVGFVTSFPPKGQLPKGLSVIDTSSILPLFYDLDFTDKRNMERGLAYLQEVSYRVFHALLDTKTLRKELIEGQYDAVITEFFYNDMDAGFAATLQVPWILFSTVVLQPSIEEIVDDVKSISTIPMLANDFPVPMSFWQRVVNCGYYAMMQLHKWKSKSEIAAGYKAAFGDIAAARGVTLPPLDDVVHNVSILFVNSHNSFAPAQSLPPNVVDIGGYHIEDPVAPLPKNLQEILDKSTQGAIYFSMGSIVEPAKFSLEMRQNLLKVLGELPYTVLWKFDENIMKDVPKNVHIRSWMPQAAILAHNNTKVFITHGGLLSTMEAIHNGVPLITMPVFGDQPSNAARAVRAGYALKVNFGTDSMAEDLKTAVLEMLANDSYQKKAKYFSFLFNKRPMVPSTLIPHYVELAIETKGAYHLRSQSKKYWWFQRSMVDQLAVLAALLYILYRIAKKFMSIVISKIKDPKRKTKKS